MPPLPPPSPPPPPPPPPPPIYIMAYDDHCFKLMNDNIFNQERFWLTSIKTEVELAWIKMNVKWYESKWMWTGVTQNGFELIWTKMGKVHIDSYCMFHQGISLVTVVIPAGCHSKLHWWWMVLCHQCHLKYTEYAFMMKLWNIVGLIASALSQNCAKIRKINRPWPKSNQPWRWFQYISMPNLRSFLPCVLKRIP